MRRRKLIALVGGAAAAWPLPARAQQTALPVIGFFGAGSRESSEMRLIPFWRGLNEAGYVEGRNVAVEYRWADDQYDRLPILAADLVRRSVNVIAAAGVNAAVAAKAATATIPIVFVAGADPVGAGLVTSLSRPGGNLTGVTDLTAELGPKHLELLHELVPTATIFALLVNPSNPNAETLSRDLQEAARALGLQLHILQASREGDLDVVFTTLGQVRATGLVIATDVFFNNQAERLAALTLSHVVPTIHPLPQFALAGGLMSYGGGLINAYRQAGVYTARVLRGQNPADLPVMQATKIELIINLKTAKALGLTVPLPMLGRADQIIE